MLTEKIFQDENKDIIVDKLMHNILAYFIQLAANDCGYSESVKDLICNQVHPLFLQAKSAESKEDNPNWWQPMSGQFSDEYWKATVVELEILEGMGAWDLVN